MDRVELGRQEVERDPPEARLQPDDARPRRRNAHRSAHVGALGERHTPRCNRRAGAARRATRRPLGVPRVTRHTPQARLREARVGELGRRGLADHDAAGAQEPLDEQRGVVGNVVLERVRAERRALARGRRQILDRDRHAVQRPDLLAPRDGLVGGPPEGDRLVRIGEDEAVQRAVHLLDPRERVTDDGLRGKLAHTDAPGELGRGREAEIEIGHGAYPSADASARNRSSGSPRSPETSTPGSARTGARRSPTRSSRRSRRRAACR